MNDMPRGIDHIGITVPDLEAATRFLVEAFGAEVLYDTHTREDKPQAGAGAERRLDLAPGIEIVAIRMMRLQNGPGIELFAMDGAAQGAAARPSDYGLQHFALYVDDMEAARERFTRAGGVLFSEARPLPPLEAGAGNEFCYGRTPWGTVIEFVSYPSAQPYREQTRLRRWTPAR